MQRGSMVVALAGMALSAMVGTPGAPRVHGGKAVGGSAKERAERHRDEVRKAKATRQRRRRNKLTRAMKQKQRRRD